MVKSSELILLRTVIRLENTRRMGQSVLLASIAMDDVLSDRSIPIRMYRKKGSEIKSRFRYDNDLEQYTNRIRQQCYLFGWLYSNILNEAYNNADKINNLPENLSDREKDVSGSPSF
jgi:hypothetical protein